MKTTITTIHVLGATIALNIRWLPTLIVLIGVFVVLAIIDIITWYFKNPVEKRESRILAQWIWVRYAKILVCIVLFVFCAHISIFYPEYWHIIWSVPLILLFWWSLTELKSISENMIAMWYTDNIFMHIPNLVDTITGIGKDAILAFFNTIITKITKYIKPKDDLSSS